MASQTKKTDHTRHDMSNPEPQSDPENAASVPGRLGKLDAAPEPGSRSFRITHTQVGPWPFGRIVSEQEILNRGKSPEDPTGEQHLAALLSSKVGDTPALLEVNEAPTETPLPPGPLNESKLPAPPATGTKELPSNKPAGTGTSEVDGSNTGTDQNSAKTQE